MAALQMQLLIGGGGLFCNTSIQIIRQQVDEESGEPHPLRAFRLGVAVADEQHLAVELHVLPEMGADGDAAEEPWENENGTTTTLSTATAKRILLKQTINIWPSGK